jgi:ribonuclease HI
MNGNDWMAWTDGSADNLRGIASYGIVLVSPEGERVTYGRRLTGRNTSNVAELMAIGLAIKLVPEGDSITVHSDSKYAINSLGKWRVRSWWKNVDLIRDIKREIGKRTVAFRWVKGHSGNALNELADRLAVAARKAV